MNNMQTKPSLVTAIALMTLVNGIFNIIWGLGLILGTFGILLLCFPISLFPILLGAFEISYATKLLSSPPQPVQPSQAIAWWEVAAILVGNIFSMVVGILALIFYNDQTVRDYFAQLNATPTPPPPPEPAPVEPIESTAKPITPEPPVEPAAPEAPAAPTIEEPQPPVAPEPAAPATEPSEQPEEEPAPAKPKRVRKVANK